MLEQVNCKKCIHYRRSTPPNLQKKAGIGSTELSEEIRDWEEQKKERARNERDADGAKYIEYRPWFEPWCALLTKAARSTRNGKQRQKIYVLCRQGNRNKKCSDFKASQKPDDDPSVPVYETSAESIAIDDAVKNKDLLGRKGRIPRYRSSEESVSVSGQVHVGIPLALDKNLITDRNNLQDELLPVPENSPLPVGERYNPALLSAASGVRMRGYEYSLVPVRHSQSQRNALVIKDKGLAQSYGIFGGPGSGKTNLLKHLLHQLVGSSFKLDEELKQGESDHRAEMRFGGLILDPKGVLIDTVQTIVESVDRTEDLIIINDEYMRQNEDALQNVIHSFLKPPSLGAAMAMAAQSAGVSSAEPFWLNELSKIFGAALDVLTMYQSTIPTLYDVADLLLGMRGESSAIKSTLEDMEKRQRENIDRPAGEDYHDFRLSRDILRRYDAFNNKDKQILQSFIEQCYGVFRRSNNAVFCRPIKASGKPKSIYDQVIEDGKIILVSVSKQNLAISRILCTLIKMLFQQTVLTRLDRKNRFDRNQKRELADPGRPVFFLADEYSDVATELPGQPMGDSLFFSQSRQFGCLGLVATQSIHMLETSPLGKGWKAIYSNFAAKIFQRVGDPETATEASDLVGMSEYRFEIFDRSHNKDGTTRGEKEDIRDRRELPIRLLTRGLSVGEAVVIGSLEGGNNPGVRFVKSPKYDPLKYDTRGYHHD